MDVELDEEDTLNFAGNEENTDAIEAVADIFNESKVNRTLSKYFKLTPEEKKNKRIQELKKSKSLKKMNQNFLNESVKQIKLKRLIETYFSSYEQEIKTKQFLKENATFNFIGKNKRGGLVFKENKNLVEITTTGKVI